MDISPDWTEEERLQAIWLLGARLADAINAHAPRHTLYQLAETISLLAKMPAAFLERNRAKIMGDLPT